MIPFEVSTKKLVRVVLVTGILLAILTLFVTNEATQKLDLSILLFLKGARFPAFNELFLILTYLGSVGFVSIATGCLGMILFIKRKFDHLRLLLGAVAGSSLLVILLKEIVGRLRPEQLLAFYSETSFSFPSGHSSASVVFYGVMAYILAQQFTDKKRRANILVGWIFFMAMIGFSRMYLGVHYASDVLGGYVIGFFSLSIAILLFEKYTVTK